MVGLLFLNPHFSRCLLGRICVTSQKNVCMEGYSSHTFDCFNLQFIMNLSPMFRLFTDNITIVTVRISVFRELFESLSAASLYRTSKQDASSGDMTKVAEFCAILFSYWLVTHYRNVPIDNCHPWKVGYPLGLENKNEVSKATAIFSLFWTLWQLTIILTLSRNNVKTIRVGYHCFSVGMSLSLLQRRKYLCKKKHFLLHLLKIKLSWIR